MNDQIELRLAPGIRHTSRDVILPEGLSEVQWLDYGRFVFKAESCAAFWKARWLQYGRKNFGDEAIGKAAKQLEIEFPDLKAVNRLNALEIREDALSPEHHFVLARVKPDAGALQESKCAARKGDGELSEDEQAREEERVQQAMREHVAEKQRLWADLALKHDLSPADLQESIRKGQVTKLERLRAGHTGVKGIETFEGFALRWDLLYRQVAPVLPEWTAAEASRALVLLAPVEVFIAELRQRFGMISRRAAESAEEVQQDDEELVQKCIEIIRAENRASTSLLQRRLRLGYTTAARILSILEERKIVGPGEGAQPRAVLALPNEEVAA